MGRVEWGRCLTSQDGKGGAVEFFHLFFRPEIHPTLSLSNAECGSVKFSPHCTGRGLLNSECKNLKLISSDLATLTYCKAQPTVRCLPAGRQVKCGKRD